MVVARLISQIVFFMRRHGRGQTYLRAAACAALAVALASSQPALAAVVNTIVQMETSLGSFNIELYDNDAPETVKNFLSYVSSGAYNGSIIHRIDNVVPGDTSARKSIIQGGGYYCAFISFASCYVQKSESIPNKYSPLRPNALGTIAMALSQDEFGNVLPDSATSQWFINVKDNSEVLSGYAVFGHVLDSGMDVVNEIADLQPSSVPSFPSLPMLGNNYVYVHRVCINDDGDGVCSETEDQALGGDGNGDGTADSKQAYVASILTSLGGLATFSADATMKFDIAGTIKKDVALSWLKTYTSPPGQSVYFNNGMFRFLMTGVMDPADNTVTLYDGAANRPTHYYAYGKTPDNPTDHWYDFSYDGETGAEISGDKIILHFVDGKRGDEDLDPTNNSITHTGAQAVVTSTSSTDVQSGGCSITATPSPDMRGGDWIAVSLFLAFVAFVRRRTRRQRI